MRIIEKIKDMNDISKDLSRSTKKIAFVPTMGAIHAGHLSLVKKASKLADEVIVSIFVNPMQFAAHEDFDKYPRDNATDIALLEEAGVNFLFMPNSQEIINDNGFKVSTGELGQDLEGEFRPHFFDGVATIVLKLFNIVQPDIAVFGEKDYQQLLSLIHI